MTLASSGSLTTAQINTETGQANFNMTRTAEMALAGRSGGGQVSWTDYRGQTKDGYFLPTSASTAGTTNGSGVYSASIGIGASAWNRWTILAVTWMNLTTPTVATVTAASIDGYNMAAVWQVNNGGTSAFSNYGIAIIAINNPTGETTGTLSITFSNATTRLVQAGAYRATGVISFVSAPGMFHENLDDDPPVDGIGPWTLVTNTTINLGSTNSCLLIASTASCSSGFASAFSFSTSVTKNYEADYVAAGWGGRWGSAYFGHGGFSAAWPIGSTIGGNNACRLRTVALSFYLR